MIENYMYGDIEKDEPSGWSDEDRRKVASNMVSAYLSGVESGDPVKAKRLSAPQLRSSLIEMMYQSLLKAESAGGSELSNNEDCFGFHSEYYIDSKWIIRDRRMWGEFRSVCPCPGRGYMKFSQYKEDIYCLSSVINCCTSNVVIKFNPLEKSVSAVRLGEKEQYKYIAVNRRGYFLYDELSITLFGFDGQEIHTHRFGRKKYLECLYVYDSKVIYSETKTEDIASIIHCVDMLTKEECILWETHKGDTEFDRVLRASYEQEWGTFPFSGAPSNIGKVSCEFLYANEKRAVAGYSRKDGYISYIINIDIPTRQWSILGCFTVPWGKELKDSSRIFGFNMLEDTMWVKTNDKDIRLIRTGIQKKAQLQGSYKVEWKLDNFCHDYYFHDGKNAYRLDNFHCRLLRIARDGEQEQYLECYYSIGNTWPYWIFGDLLIHPDEYGGQSVYIDGEYIYCLSNREAKELIKNAKPMQPVTTPPKQSDLKVNKASAQKESFGLSENIKKMPETSGSDEKLLEKLSMLTAQNTAQPVRTSTHDSGITLEAFRQNAPQAVGFRDALLAYRKSLPNSWDYNAYVGILLSVSGSKHGDATCMNYAIGQGDNGNNTRKTLEAKGLMPVFEKYKGKKIDRTIMLSNVEDEIIAIAPEYAQIRQRFHEIINTTD